MPTRLAALDLDGTLLRSDATISERTRAAVRTAAAAGIEPVLVTARGPRTVAEIAAELGLEASSAEPPTPGRRPRGASGTPPDVRGEAICSNGAIVLDLASGAIAKLRELETEVALELVHGLRERLPGILFAVERETFAHEPGFAAWNYTPPPETRVAAAEELLGRPPTKLILRHAGHEVEAIAALARELAGARASVSVSGEWVVEVSPAGVNKAAALAELCEERGIAAADVVAFGDHLNDLPMLAWAGRGVAVANAHPEVVDLADEVTASNDEDGVALVLERLSA